MIGWVSALIALTVVILVVLTALMGWAGRLKLLERLSLCAMAAGLLWAGPARFLGYAPGLGDLLFVSGLLGHLMAIYGSTLWVKADGLDGAIDGRLGDVVVLHRVAPQLDERATAAKAVRRPRA